MSEEYGKDFQVRANVTVTLDYLRPPVSVQEKVSREQAQLWVQNRAYGMNKAVEETLIALIKKEQENIE